MVGVKHLVRPPPLPPPRIKVGMQDLLRPPPLPPPRIKVVNQDLLRPLPPPRSKHQQHCSCSGLTTYKCQELNTEKSVKSLVKLPESNNTSDHFPSTRLYQNASIAFDVLKKRFCDHVKTPSTSFGKDISFTTYKNSPMDERFILSNLHLRQRRRALSYRKERWLKSG